MTVLEILAIIIMVAGSLIMLAAAIGVLRFPDFFARLHAAGKGDTLGQGLILLGLMLPAGLSLISFKLALIILFIFIFNPTATHALARGGWVLGMKPWEKHHGEPPSEDEDDAEGPEDHA